MREKMMDNNNNNNNRPLLLMDVDGVLGAFDPEPGSYRVVEAAGYRLRVGHNVAEWVEELEDHFEVVWSTMWMEKTEELSRALGFGQGWEWIDFHAHWTGMEWTHARRSGAGVGGYKHPGIEAVVGERAVVGFDDDFEDWQIDWALERTDAGFPTVLLAPDPYAGLERKHVDAALIFARAWAEHVGSAA